MPPDPIIRQAITAAFDQVPNRPQPSSELEAYARQAAQSTIDFIYQDHHILAPLSDAQRAFLAAYCICGSISMAERVADVAPSIFYKWLNGYTNSGGNIRNFNPDFVKAWEWAKQVAGDRLEEAAIQRAVYGIERPIYNKRGEVVGYDRKYSDTLLLALLQANLPHKYKKVVDQRITSEITSRSVNVNVNMVTECSDEQLLQLAGLTRPNGGGLLTSGEESESEDNQE